MVHEADLSEREKQVLAVLARIEAGESERSACDAENINRGTFRSAALKVQAADQYARATYALAHAQAEKLEQAIEDMREGRLDATQARVEIDARKWFASKFLPKQFGDRVEQVHSGAIGIREWLTDAE